MPKGRGFTANSGKSHAKAAGIPIIVAATIQQSANAADSSALAFVMSVSASSSSPCRISQRDMIIGKFKMISSCPAMEAPSELACFPSVPTIC